MKTYITLILMALALIFPGQVAEARVIKQEQSSWLDKIFSNDQPEMIQKSPFSQPQMKKQNPRLKQPLKQTFDDGEEPRTREIKTEPAINPRQRPHQAHQNDRGKQHIQNQRQQRMTAQKQRQTVNVND